MGKVIANQSVSLDGFSAGPNVEMGNGMGDGGEELHTWIFSEGGTGASSTLGAPAWAPLPPCIGRPPGRRGAF